MATILKTTDYSIFKKHESNRDLNPSNLKRIMQSVKSQNLLQFRPILVDKEMKVIDGQHRLQVAKDLGIEIYYHINKSSDHEDIVFLNAYQKQWEMKDFINYYISLGNKQYRAFEEYAKSKSLNVTEILRFMSGNEKDKTMRQKVKTGNLDFFNDTNIAKANIKIAEYDSIMDIIKKYSVRSPRFIKTYKFKTGLFNFLSRDDIDIKTFLNKLTLKMEAIKECATHYSYYSMFMDIYNYKRNNPIV
jgi:hypothetical protein